MVTNMAIMMIIMIIIGEYY